MLAFYPTTCGNTEKTLEYISNIFYRLKYLSKDNKELELIEYHDMFFDEGYISPHDYYEAKYKYKNCVFETGTFFDSHMGKCVWCNIFELKKDFVVFYKGVETDYSLLTEEQKKDYKNITFSQKENNEYQRIASISVHETVGFEYKWTSFCEYREEIERLLFPEIYKKNDI